MSDTYAKIDPTQNPNVVVNIQIMSSSDPQDPNFTWVDITSLNTMPLIGWLYSGGVFSAPGPVYPPLSQCQLINLQNFNSALQVFIENFYTTQTRLEFFMLYYNATQNNLPNRAAYIAPMFTWSDSIIQYAASYTQTVMNITDQATALNSTWNFSSLSSGNPNITLLAAIQIMN